MDFPTELFSVGTSRAIGFSAASRLIGAIFDEEEPERVLNRDLPQIPGYAVVRPLGSGGGGEVFLAVREGSPDLLAIKLFRRAVGNTTSDKRAWRELDLLSDLNLAGVPAVTDFGIADSHMYVVTTHVEGLTLMDHCDDRALDCRQRVQLMARVARVVQDLHEHSVIHRDLKPDNIIIQPDGDPVVVDFGIASLLTETTSTITEEGNPLGTLGFMSPEQARGDRQRLSTRSDVFSLGAILCFILTKKTPHDVNIALHEAVRRVAQDPPRNARELDPTLPNSLADIITKATAQNPDERYPTAMLFADDLERWLRNEPIE